MTDTQPAVPVAQRNPLTTEAEFALLLAGVLASRTVAADAEVQRTNVTTAIAATATTVAPGITPAQSKRLVALVTEHGASLGALLDKAVANLIGTCTDVTALANLAAAVEDRKRAISSEQRIAQVKTLRASGFSDEEIQRMLVAIGLASPAAPAPAVAP